MRQVRRKSESGFALLFIYAMAATVAVMLYMELPRVAFEAQRDKEQLLIDRGEQYSRAIGLFVRKFNRYPSEFKDLENTQNLRFLRKRYVDPMTGKDEWRIIHVGPGGAFTDSLLYTQKKDDKKTEAQSFITEMQQTGGNQIGVNPQGVNLATRVRPSDQAGAPGDPNNPTSAQPADPNAPPPPPPPPNGMNGPVQVLPDGRIVPVGFQQGALQSQQGFQQQGFQQQGIQQQGIQPQGFQPGAPPGFGNGLPPGAQVPPGVQLPPGVNVQPGAFQSAVPGQQPQVGTPGAAANLINQILTTPRPGGLNGTAGGFGAQPPTVDQFGNPAPQQTPQSQQPQAAANPATAQPQQQTIGGGIAGVATKLEQDGIKLYRERKAYNEWEFVYDITKDPTRGGGAASAAGTQQPGANQPAGTQPAGSQPAGNSQLPGPTPSVTPSK